jgi:hypothetical protein
VENFSSEHNRRMAENYSSEQNRRTWSIIGPLLLRQKAFLRSELINQFHFPKFRKHKKVETLCTIYNLLAFLLCREEQSVHCR